MEDKQLSPEQSIQLIQSMIQKTKQNLFNSSRYFLLWGYTTFICFLTQYLLITVLNYPQHYIVWMAIIVAAAISIFWSINDSKSYVTKTYVDDMIGIFWMGLGLLFFALVAVFSIKGWGSGYPVFILLYGFGTFTTGRMIQFKPLIWGGLLNFPIAIATSLVSYQQQLLLAALAILLSYIVPGHLLKWHFKKQLA